MSQSTAREVADREAECIIAICGSFVPGGWAHPGDKCVELVSKTIALALAERAEAEHRLTCGICSCKEAGVILHRSLECERLAAIRQEIESLKVKP